jgi:hypothetical protein
LAKNKVEGGYKFNCMGSKIVLHPDTGVAGAGDLLIGFSTHNLAKLVLDEVVEGLDVLLGQTPSLQGTTKPSPVYLTSLAETCT